MSGLPGARAQKILIQPINLIFRHLQNKNTVSIWLADDADQRIEGQIIGFDEYMNLVIDNAVEVHLRKHTRESAGRILLRGNNVAIIQKISEP